MGLGKYVWCRVFEDGAKWPIGRGKDWDYVMSCAEKDYPDKYRLYELIEVVKGTTPPKEPKHE